MFRTYPVILSLENHCSAAYQVKMAEYFVSILGDYLYTEPVGEDEVEFPSPEALARKIILKGKKMKDDEALHSIDLDEDEEFELLPPANSVSGEEICGKDSNESSGSIQHTPIQHLPHNLEKSLSDLINYCAAKKFQSFEDCEEWNFWEMASFQELKALKLANEEGESFVHFNKKHLSRIYPKGTRTDSSNYDPIPFWSVGCQLVALNYQTQMEYMFLNDAKFAQNGGCGYVLKPNFMRSSEINFSPTDIPDPSCKRHMLIRIISGQQLPKPYCATGGEVVDPYVTINVVGHPLDYQKKRTRYICNNGFDPMWDEMFLINLHLPEIAMIIFLVKDYSLTGKNLLLGKYAIPYTSIVEGYRHIPLCDDNGKQLISASLFVHITIGD